MRYIGRVELALGALLALGCGAIEERTANLPVERFSELMLVDPELLEATGDADTQLPGLPALLGALLGAADPSTAELDWLEQWSEASDEPAAFQRALSCGWLRADPGNDCDDECRQCASQRLAPAAAPFRLTAIVYRPDLALETGVLDARGQLRLVYALVADAVGERERVELDATVIVELPLSTRQSASGWAQRFHALAGERAQLPRFRRALRALVDEARAVDDPDQVSLRVRDAAFADGRMLAFAPDAGRLRRIALQDTIDLSRVSAEELRRSFARWDPADAPEPSVPSAWWADSVDRGSGWPSMDDERLSHALRLISCHGCHADDHSLDGFHIRPGAHGRARLSRFLHAPDDLENDELARREDALRTLLRRRSD